MRSVSAELAESADVRLPAVRRRFCGNPRAAACTRATGPVDGCAIPCSLRSPCSHGGPVVRNPRNEMPPD